MAALGIYTGGSTNGTDGTLVSSGNKATITGLSPTYTTIHARSDTPGYKTTDTTFTLPALVEMSFDGGSTWKSSADNPVSAPTFTDANAAIRVRQTALAGSAAATFTTSGTFTAMAVSRSAVGAKLHDDWADGDLTANPAWTVGSGTAAVSGGAIRVGSGAYGLVNAAPSSLANSDYVSWRAKLPNTDSSTYLTTYLSQTGTSNWYYARVYGDGKYIISKKVSGTATDLFISAAGVIGTPNSYHNYALAWTSSGLSFYMDDALVKTVSDTSLSSLSTPQLFLEANPVGASTYVEVDDVAVMDSWNVTCSGLPTGYKLRVISDAGGTAVATATESSGTATVDLTGKTGAFPYYGVQVLTAASSVVTTLNPSATVSGHTATGTFGGDTYTYG